MIGNVTIVGSMEQLNCYLSLRGNFLSSYSAMCKQNNTPCDVHKNKIIVVDDIKASGDDYIVASILLPKSRTMPYLIDDNALFKDMYWYDLDNDPDVQEIIAILLTGILERNFDYTLYFDNDFWYQIASALSEYLYVRFGIMCYGLDEVMANNSIILQQSIAPESVTRAQSIVDRYELSNRQPGQLFVQY